MEPSIHELIGQRLRPVREETERSIIFGRKDERREKRLLLEPNLREKHRQSVEFVGPRHRGKLKRLKLLKKSLRLVVEPLGISAQCGVGMLIERGPISSLDGRDHGLEG